ncbi:MAG: zf-HC2 domain-containing protein [Candidatus Omnitrophica bacterium]|nr:zf-HC2 domain-containing protein [Candidatus Omnitrophota bacterium]
MKNRLCPSEENLSEYLSGIMSRADKNLIEQHLANCQACRTLVAETHSIARKSAENKIHKLFRALKREHLWLTACVISLSLSFVFSNYFIQFLTASLLLGIKWIIDSKTTKTLIMIHKTLKTSDAEDIDETLKNDTLKR